MRREGIRYQLAASPAVLPWVELAEDAAFGTSVVVRPSKLSLEVFS